MLGFSPKHAKQLLHDAYRKHESIKKREYTQRAHEVEHGVIIPLVLSATGGMDREAATFYKRLADRISTKEQKQYSVVMGWICCRLSFAIIHFAILCIRASTSSHHHPSHELNITVATSEGSVPSDGQWIFPFESLFLPLFLFSSCLFLSVYSTIWSPIQSCIISYFYSLYMKFSLMY